MKQVQLSLIPAPGAKPEFLATVEALDDVDEWNAQLPSKIILEGYTRDPWAWKPAPGNVWVELVCVSVDGRNKLPGFVKYLKERQKCAFGRFSPTAAFVVSYIQKKAASSNEMSVRLCFDLHKLSNCPLIKRKVEAPTEAPIPAAASKPPPPASSSRKKSGILGNLLGAQKNINKHMEHSAKPKKTAAAAVADPDMRTAQQVLSEFRQKMEQEMLDFDSCGEVELKAKIVLSESQKGLSDEDKARITMDVLKYIVLEAADECNEDWIAHKEPSEFMDECVIAVYKEGHAPEEALEEVNRVELTEDARAEQMSMQEAGRKKQANREAKIDQERFKQAHEQEANEIAEIAALNSNKRDRRTIEEIQRDLGQPDIKKIKQ